MAPGAAITAEERTGSLLAEEFRLLSSQVPTMYLVLVINALFLQFVIADDRWDFRSYLASLVLACVAAVRVHAWRRVAARPWHDDAQMRRAMRATRRTAFLVATGLAVWSIHIILTSDPLRQSYVPLFAALSTITCAACLIAQPSAAYVVICGGAIPISLTLLIVGNPAVAGTGANLLMIAALMVGLVRRQHHQLRRMVASHGEVEREKAKVAVLAFSDPLTGLPNRRAFLDELAAAGRDAAVAMFDLDGFKAINDTFGHRAGDGVLKAVGERLRGLLPQGDLLARLGGDEFALLIRGVASLDAARIRLEPIAAAFEHPFLVDGKALKIGTSIGVAHSHACACPTVELIHRADLALYESKSGRSGICGFEAGMEENVRRRVAIEQAASDESALSRLSLRFQPIFRRGGMEVEALEALARWSHPVLGDIPPSELIAVAERRGTIHLFTTLLLRRAIDAASRWPESVGLSFNLSAADLDSPSICELIARLCAERGFPPGRLSVEITETALLKDVEAARAVIERLRAMGIRILLDDFGAGFASIGYLRQIRFDGIKLDGSLVSAITGDAAARDLLHGVLQLCRAIGTPVTAEMVETADHLRLVETMGVDRLQGFHFGLPMTGEEVPGFLAAAGARAAA
jgi:diguanylate cyclase (GGDEF)-like protein